MADLRFDAVQFDFAGRDVLRDFSFRVEPREFVVLLGPSGSGKSTVLRLAAGLETPRRGLIRMKDKVVAEAGRLLVAPPSRGVSMVFQELALWPHMTAEEHLAFAAPGVPRHEMQDALASVGLAGFAGRRPGEMSGGERQRLALARALASKPGLLLLDEPFSSLDPALRDELSILLRRLHRERAMSVLYVTHNQEEAFALAERVALLHRGRIEQEGTPEDLYRRPETEFAASFVGRGVIVTAQAEGHSLVTAWGTVPNPAPWFAQASHVRVVIRPEDVVLDESGAAGVVVSVAFVAGRYLLEIESLDHRLLVYSSKRLETGNPVKVRLMAAWPFEPPA